MSKPIDPRLSVLAVTVEAGEGKTLPTLDLIRVRGALGFWLRRITCLSPARCHEVCRNPGGCLYSRIFEPVAGSSGRYHHLPRPFALRETLGSPKGGQRWEFLMVATGPALDNIAYVILALSEAARHGFSNGGGQAFTLRLVRDQTGQVIFDGDAEVIRFSPAPLIEDDLARVAGEVSGGDALEVIFASPTAINVEGRPVLVPSFAELIITTVRRWWTLSQAYGVDADAIDTRWRRQDVSLLKSVGIVRSSTYPSRRVRFSSRQGQEQVLNGILGSVTYHGNLTPWAEAIAFASFVQIGKGTTFGQGSVLPRPTGRSVCSASGSVREITEGCKTSVEATGARLAGQ